MNYTERILKIAYSNNGTVTSSQVTHAGIHRQFLSILVKKGLLEHSGRGIYVLPTVFDDEMYNLQIRFKRGIFSHETALFLLGLSDRTPIKYSMTFPLKYNTTTVDSSKVKYYRFKDDFYKLGIISIPSPNGNMVKTYNSERTLCDILRTTGKTDIQIVTDAFKIYTRMGKKDIPLLSEYAKLFRVDKKLRSYLEVLL